jgi:hypothetical protein
LVLVVTGIALCWHRADNRLWARGTVVLTLVTAVLLGAMAALVWYCLGDTSSPSDSSSDLLSFAFSFLGAYLRALMAVVVFAIVVIPSTVWAVVLAVTGVCIGERSRSGFVPEQRGGYADQPPGSSISERGHSRGVAPLTTGRTSEAVTRQGDIQDVLAEPGTAAGRPRD